jgi:hypothetical protein
MGSCQREHIGIERRLRQLPVCSPVQYATTNAGHQLVAPGFFLLDYQNGNFISNNVLPLQFSRKTLSFYAMGQSPTFY